MAEGLAGAVLGSASEEPTEAGEGAASTALDPAAAAAAMDTAKHNPTLAERAGLYFERQARLVSIQTEHLHEQREVVLANLKLRRHSERLRLGMQLLFALVFTAIIFGFLGMAYDAAASKSVVVESFDAPPKLADRGLGGEVVARDLASRIAAISRLSNAHSIARSDDAQADSGTRIKLEIPEAGISLEELRRFLRLWLGHDRHLSGDLRVEAEGELAMTVRVDGADPVTLRGPSTDAEALMQAAAERAFAILDPVNSVVYLAVKGRRAEAVAEAEDIARNNPGSVTPAEAYSLWSDVDLNESRAARTAEISMSLDRRLMVGWMEAMFAAHELGHAEAEFGYAQRLLETRRSDQPREQQNGHDRVMNEARARIAYLLGDFSQPGPGKLQFDNGNSVAEQLASDAELAIRRHDAALGQQLMARVQMAGGVAPIATFQLHWLAAESASDWPAARTAAEAMVSAQREMPAATKETSDDQQDLKLATLYLPELALSLAMTGDIGQARAVAASTPVDCYFCLRARALIAAASGDEAGADHWFGEAVRQAPSIPLAYAEWGKALAKHGDLADAAAKLALAHQRGPQWADPLKEWGDVLAKQGKTKDALAKYDEALKYAPNWKQLEDAREAASRS